MLCSYYSKSNHYGEIIDILFYAFVGMYVQIYANEDEETILSLD